jgi:hypothetical protein
MGEAKRRKLAGTYPMTGRATILPDDLNIDIAALVGKPEMRRGIPVKITITRDDMRLDPTVKLTRRCGGCTLCCRLLPVPALDKGYDTCCQHQRSGTGCAIYNDRPLACESWSCAWLCEATGTEGMPRPDQLHFVIDPFPDRIKIVREGKIGTFSAAQVWLDPAFPAVRHDPRLKAYMLLAAERWNWPTTLRLSAETSISVFAPPLCADRQWHEQSWGPGISDFVLDPGFWSPPGTRP